MSKPLILVTGATGTVGSELVPQLVESGARVRVLARDPERARKFGRDVEVIKGDLEKPETLAPAFADAEKVFVLSNYPLIPVLEGNAYHAAWAAGVKHIVKLSGRHINSDFFGETPRPLRLGEARLRPFGPPILVLSRDVVARDQVLGVPARVLA